MAAAIAAARAGASVTLLERLSDPGKKLLATGNGRCNLSNRDFDVRRDYRSSDPSRLPAFFRQFGVQDTVRFLESCGLLVTDRNGYLYPRSMQAGSVREALAGELKRCGVSLVCGCTADAIVPDNGFLVRAGEREYGFDRLILACGTAAGLPEAKAGDGFALAKALKLRVIEPLPALGALRCPEPFFRELAGVRCLAGLELSCRTGNRRERWQESGEVQLTAYGISGIPVFQCSRYAAAALREGGSVTAFLDFLPEYDAARWDALCRRQYQVCLGKEAALLACGMLARKLALVLLRQSGIAPGEPVGEGIRDRLCRLFALIRRFPVTVTAANPISQAQVCAGGVSLAEVKDSLEVRRLPGLFLCGEMLDVDGRCGGYNLQWAWTSGVIAGRHAAEDEET